MGKVIHYKLCTRINYGTEEDPSWKEILSPVEMIWNEINEEIARKEAYNGEYTIEDDGQPEPETPDVETVTWDELDEAYQEGVDSV